MTLFSTGCKYHSNQSSVNMNISAEGVICFKSEHVYGILTNQFYCHGYYAAT